MTTPTADRNRWPSPLHGWYVTLVLLLAYTFSFVDRQVLNLLVEPIQADLGLSDTQISLLQGFAFVFTYVALSVPIGRMVDRFNRIAIMIGGVLVWSATTVACGLSRSFEQLFGAPSRRWGRRSHRHPRLVVAALGLLSPRAPVASDQRLSDGSLHRRRLGDDCRRHGP